MRVSRVFVLGLLTLGVASCGGSSRPANAPQSIVMTSEIVDREGRRLIEAPRTNVCEATVGALAVLGYTVAFADPSATMIKTAPMRTLRVAPAKYSPIAEAWAAGSSYARSYVITLSDDPRGTIVRAAPRRFVNGQDVSGTEVWSLDGPDGERALWGRLFSEIASNLQVPSTNAVCTTARP